jgi:signal transduction histidine kinase
VTKGQPSFRSQLLIGSVLWTFGVLLVVSVLLILFLAHNPRPHMIIIGWLVAVPAVLTLSAGLACMTAGAFRIRRSLQAVDQLRTKLTAVHRGDGTQVDGRYPAEVQPLVDDLNALLAERDDRITRAVAKAGDLAHGLKTPLAVLSCDADRAAARGDAELSRSLADQVDRMRRQVDYHLAHAQAAAAAGAARVRTAVAPSVDGLIRTMERLHAPRRLELHASVPSDHAVRCRREDLDEMLGNLLDNACKWCRTRVDIDSVARDGFVSIAIADDGPGIDPSLQSVVIERGVRADERTPGSGLGLAIVRDLAELYGGTISLGASPLGGVRAELRLPIQQTRLTGGGGQATAAS